MRDSTISDESPSYKTVKSFRPSVQENFILAPNQQYIFIYTSLYNIYVMIYVIGVYIYIHTYVYIDIYIDELNLIKTHFHNTPFYQTKMAMENPNISHLSMDLLCVHMLLFSFSMFESPGKWESAINPNRSYSNSHEHTIFCFIGWA